jgi:hypothetical protein
MKYKNLILVVLSTLVFSGIFSFNYLVDLDSVYFYKEAYFDLTNKINIWGSYDTPFGGLHLILWLYPVTYLAGFVGNLLNLDWNILVRLFFYLPGIFLSIYSAQKLAKSLGYKNNGQFLMGLIYVFNTYFILLIDGGQLGVMLAYSILPLAVEAITNFKFFKTLSFLSLIAIFDPRFLMLSLTLGLLLSKFEFSKIFKLVLTLTFVMLINFYWIYPIIKLVTIEAPTFISNLKLVTLKDSLLLYQPHWPFNEFGKTIEPNVLFLVFPILLILSNLIKPSKVKVYLSILFLSFAFLAKGESRPFGEIYSYVINNFPFASVFRDSTKFFPLLILAFSLVVAKYYDGIKNKLLIYLIPVSLIIPLVPGLIFGTNNNLKGESEINNFLELKNIVKDNNFSRTIYIPHKPQLAYQTENNQAVDGRVLAGYLPFAVDNYGSEDRFNFMQRDHYLNFFRSLGIKNLVYLSSKKPEIATLENTVPEKYYIDKMAVVVGSPIGAQKLVPEYGVIFIEDGKTDLGRLLQISNEKLFFILNNKSLDDLIIAGLKNKFIDPSLLAENSWGKYLKDDYLTWKYQLLIRDVDTKEINFDSGIILSTQENEVVKVRHDFEGGKKYKIFIRGLAGKNSRGISIDDKQLKIPDGNIFRWFSQDIVFGQDTEGFVLKNNGGFNVIGNILIIEEDEYQQYYKKVRNELDNYKIYNSDSKLPVSKINSEPKNGWLILNQSYHKSWRLGESHPFPINSITNGFEVNESNINSKIYFKDQEILDTAVNISLVSVLTLFMSYLGHAVSRKSHKNSV